ncbi:MAG: Asp-tRNA(Asn)/Glu-tRNA(Gln) amidotransferase subunit GatB [Candidatus Nitrohelix vancouverensis]|uniref:Aspartyl/glutamyl-tRNA(Asn/Gln) amidotransferase subunit B n=1 Tax=Candidatus Nitrohelix vancouverensis TaxID=2705534 RepID=A0A7T0G4C9_9BACT|nr:MAG: Asp-tRNA(Asn)/Glu-tRNA(Gln) amidotransferase subunit GatB [Candidatus Nitrohelix vancouverensis]
MNYEVVIGLEVHTQMKTRTKIFCSCSTQFGQAPNENTCPICLGLPGVLPVLNKQAVDYAIAACIATHCEVQETSRFDRKNYFYPDLPKGYQISQFALPIGLRGRVNITVDGVDKRIGITRIHMEEDAGKSIHGENLGSPGKSYVDYNRTGVPLIEIVSEPELRSAEEAKAYLIELRSILQYAGVSDCNMEEGSFRCDANVSLRPVGQEAFGTRAEIKNLNSFRFIQKAIEYETDRQGRILDQGDVVVQETRLYDSDRGVTFSMRSKEEAHDYRYFSEPDLVPIVLKQEMIDAIRSGIQELPEEKRDRYTRELEIPDYDARVLTATPALADYFESCVQSGAQAKTASNWIMGDLLGKLNKENKDIVDCPVPAPAFSELLKMIDDQTVSGKIAKTVFEEMYASGKSAPQIVEEKGMTQISDEGSIETWVDEVIAANPGQAEEFRNGKEKLLGFFVGQVMKASKGQANPALLNKIIKEKLS